MKETKNEIANESLNKNKILSSTPDQLVRATAGSGGIRIFSATTTQLVNETIRRHRLYPLAGATLGRTMTGALLLAANLKNKEALTVKFSGDGVLGTVTADATPEGVVRGYVDNPTANLPLNPEGKLDVGGGIGRGILSVTRFTGLKGPITGSVGIKTGEVADDIIEYLYTSEQTPSSVGLGVLIDSDLTCLSAGGFFIQLLPEVKEEVIERLEKTLANIKSVSALVNKGLNAAGIIGEVLAGFDDINILSTTDLSFRCQCSKMRISDMLVTLGKGELKKLVADGHAEVKCHFCNNAYTFNQDELAAIYAVANRRREDGTFDTTGLL